MKNARRARLCLEALESRFCPSLTIHSTSGNLMISGTPKGNMVVTEPSANLFNITDNGANDGTFTATNIYFTFTSKANKSLDINLMTHTLGGNIVINAGTGLELLPGDTGTGIRNGIIGGSVTETGGSGNEVLALGTDPTGHNPANLTIGGDVTLASTSNNTALNSDVLDTPFVGVVQTNAVIIGGNVTTANAGIVRLGPNTTVGKNVSVSAAQKVALRQIEFDGATIKGNLSVTGSTGGSNVQLDGINFGFATGPQIGGSVTANLGSGNNTFDLDDGTVVSANVNVTGGGGSDTYFIDGVVNGSLTANTGNGATSFETGGFGPGSVAGNLSLTEGNGNNLATTLDGTVGGNLSITQGNGNNSAGVVVGTAPGGLFTYTGGNGTDSLTLGNTGTAAFWNVYITFGTGMNTLTLNPSGLDTYSGTVIGTGGMNTFVQNNDTLVNMSFINFP